MAASFTFQDDTIKVIESLKSTFGVSTNGEMISRALALAKVVAEEADDEHTVVLAGKDNKPIKIILDR
jgi:hypothetical protein